MEKKYWFYRIFSPLQQEAQIPNSGADRQRQKRSDISLTALNHRWSPLPGSAFKLPKRLNFPKDPKDQSTSLLAKLPPLPDDAAQASQDFANSSPQIPLGLWPTHLMTGSPTPHHPSLWQGQSCSSKRHQHTEVHWPSPSPAFAQGYRHSHCSRSLAAEN